MHERMSRAEARVRYALLSLVPPFHDVLLPLPGAARHARDIVTGACAVWDLPHLAAPATLIASGLVNHVCDHVATMMTVIVLHHDKVLYLSVRSGTMLDSGSPHADTNLDLTLIHASASSWGFLLDGGDLVTWATLPFSSSDHRRLPD
ncbi:hypothetical protein Aab01nite_54170 [Paractinoplanes abujensis]|nr:hypothetical protein Aab01nite_54170 [Actinoplanes abujensis]